MVDGPQPGEPGDPDEPTEPGSSPFDFDLSGIDFSSIDPSMFDPSRFDLSQFDLSGLDLSNLDLSNLDLSALQLSSADLARAMEMLRTSGPVNWQIARQMAQWVARGEATMTNPMQLAAAPPAEDPVSDDDRRQLDELVHAAQTLVVGETGLTAAFGAELHAVNRSGWVDLHLDALRPVLEALATTLGEAMQLSDDDVTFEHPSLGASGEIPGAANLIGAIAPMLLGVQSGSMIGALAQRALGGYDWPLPTGVGSGDDVRGASPILCFVVPNIDAFESAWSLPRQDLRFALALHEVVHAAQRSVPWVRDRLVRLAVQFVSAYELDTDALDERFGDVDPADPASLQRMVEQPEQLLGAMSSPRQAAPRDELRRLTSVLDGYADLVMEQVGHRLIPTFDRIHEAMQRHRLERGEAERFIEGLLGLKLEREDYDRGAAFCRGVHERAGLEGLNRLWERAEMQPTPAELDAPGLWLARIDL